MEVKIEHILDVATAAAHIVRGNISVREHPEHKDLAIYNYTPKALYDVKQWDRTLSVCRGLIINEQTGEVLARPFAKFWNMNDEHHPETLEANLPRSSPQIMEKMDGSLGILYHVNGEPAIATRGSFTSDQALWATKWYREHSRLCAEQMSRPQYWPNGYTPLFEVIYPENRIVCSYNFSGLVLIGLVNISNGQELPYERVKFWANHNHMRVCYGYNHIPANDDTKNREGYVLTWFDPYIKVKVKFEEYVRLHRIITGFSEKSVWETLKTKGARELYAMISDTTLPAEFRTWLESTVDDLYDEFRSIERAALAVYQRHGDFESRKDFAQFAFKQAYTNMSTPSVVFAMLDDHEYTPIIWKALKPRGDKTFKVDGEA